MPSGKILQSRYQIQGLIEKTIIFSLYVAKDLHFSDKSWLIKEIDIFSQDPENATMLSKKFQEKVSYLARLEHPNLAKIIDYFIENKKNYLVMEYIEGQTLKQVLKSSMVFSENQVLVIGTQLSGVIEYLHNIKPTPLLLLNLNPSDIYLNASDILLLDYGLSPFLAQSGKVGYLLSDGKGYCAPEMLKEKADNRADIYSLGVILYQLLTALDPKEVETFTSIRIKNPEVSSHLDHLIKKATKINPDERQLSMNHFRKEIARIPRVKKKEVQIEDRVEVNYNMGSKFAVLMENQKKGISHDIFPDDRESISYNLDRIKSKIVPDEDDRESISYNLDRIKSKIVPDEDYFEPEITTIEHISISMNKIKSRIKPEIKFKRFPKVIYLVLIIGMVIAVILSLVFKYASKSNQIITLTPANIYKVSAIDNYNNKKYVEAIENFTKALSIDPSDGLASILLQNSHLAINGKPVYTIGVIMPLSGYGQKKGEDTLRGIALAQMELNKREPFSSKGIEIIVEDDLSSISGAINATNVLCKNKNVMAVIGPLNSDQLKSTSPIFNNNKVVCISPTAICPGVDDLGPYTFRMCGTCDLQANILTKFCIEQSGFSRIAIIYDATQDYSAGMARVFKDKTIEMGGSIIVEKSFLSENPDLTRELSEIIRYYPDVLFFSGYHKEAANTAITLRAMGSNLQIIGGNSLYTEELIEIGGKAVEGILFTSYFHPDYDDKTRSFTEEYRKTFRLLPSARAALIYDSIMLLADSINNKKIKQEEIRDYLLSLKSKEKKFNGVTGKTSFDSYGNSCRDLFLITIKDSKFILVNKLTL